MADGVPINMTKKENKEKVENKVEEKEKEEIIEKDLIEETGIKNFFIRFLKGIVIGIGAILPGLSGGVLAVIFGIYDPAIKFLGNLRHKFWKNVLFFIPAGIGLLLGIFLFSIVVEKAFSSYLAVFACLFIGFVIGTLPSLYKSAGERGRSKSDIIVGSIVGILLILLMVFGQKFTINIEGNIIVWFLAGGLIILGFIIPGLSPSNFLIYFGLYDKMAAGIGAIDLGVIIPLILGGIVSALLFAKLVSYLIKKFYSKVYHIILGLVLGSSIAIFPTVIIPDFIQLSFSHDAKTLILLILASIGLFIIGGISTYFFSKLEEKKAN